MKKRSKDFNPDLLRDLHAEPLLRALPAGEALAIAEAEVAGSQALATLNAHESKRFNECEEIINKGLTTFIEVGQALAEIRNRRLYRSEHRTFEAYCQNRWQLKRQRAYELMGASEVAGNLSEISDIQYLKESHTVPLQNLTGDEQLAAWRELWDETGGKITANKLVKKVAEVQERKKADYLADLSQAAKNKETEELAAQEHAREARKDLAKALAASPEMITMRITGQWLIQNNVEHIWRELRSVTHVITQQYTDDMTLEQFMDLGLLKINKTK